MLQQLISCLNASRPFWVCYSFKRDPRTSLQYVSTGNTAGLGGDLSPIRQRFDGSFEILSQSVFEHNRRDSAECREVDRNGAKEGNRSD